MIDTVSSDDKLRHLFLSFDCTKWSAKKITNSYIPLLHGMDEILPIEFIE